MNANQYSAALLRALAVESGSDPRTVGKILRGEPVRGVAGDRIREALRRRGEVTGVPLAMASGGPLAAMRK